MSSDIKRRTRRTIARLLPRNVIALSVIALAGLLATTAIGLVGNFALVDSGLRTSAITAARVFDDFLGALQSDLQATADMLPVTHAAEASLRLMLDRHPEVFEALLIDPNGVVLAQRRRMGASLEPVGAQPWLDTVSQGTFFMGEVSYEPYGVPFVDMAAPVYTTNGEFWTTLVARVDLTALWETAIRLPVGESGHVVIVDETGQVLAYRNLQLVKAGLNLSELTGITPQEIAGEGLFVYEDLAGRPVVVSGTALNAAPWYAVVEQPTGEALQGFLTLAAFLAVLFLVTGLLAVLILRFVRRRVVSPLATLQAGVEILGPQQLDYRIDIGTPDEMGVLATAFNALADRLQETIGSLEQRVAERTRGLQTAAEVGRATTQVLDPGSLLDQVVNLVRDRFDLYYVGLFLLDPQGEFAVLRAGTGDAGLDQIHAGHRLAVDEESMVGRCIVADEAYIALDVGDEPHRFDNPLLPETRSELAVPLRARGRVIGAMSVQDRRPAAFDETDVAIMQTMADQVAVAIDNANLFARTQAALEEMEIAQRRYIQEAWGQFVRKQANTGYVRTPEGLSLLGSEILPETRAGAEAGKVVIKEGKGADSALLIAPIVQRDQPIGALGLRLAEGSQWTDEQIALVETVAEQVALTAENLRLLDETQRRASREQAIREISERMERAVDLESLFRITAQELQRALRAKRAYVRLAPSTGSGQVPATGSGQVSPDLGATQSGAADPGVTVEGNGHVDEVG